MSETNLNNIYAIPSDFLTEEESFDPTLFDTMNGHVSAVANHEVLTMPAEPAHDTVERIVQPENVAQAIMRTGERIKYEREHYGLAA